jgi:carbon-monoxide dehydrogenase medium subunit
MPRYLINIKRIKELDYIDYEEHSGLRLGALAKIQDIQDSVLVRNRFPIMSQAASRLGTTHVRNLGTIGGNLANASPAAEFAPPLLALGATVKVAGIHGQREISLGVFFEGPGKSALRRDEILTEIQIPDTPLHTEGVYLKYSTRPMDVAIASTAILVSAQDGILRDVRICLGAVGPTPIMAKEAERALRGRTFHNDPAKLIRRAAAIAREESMPIDDLRGSADYRRDVVETLVTEGLARAIRRVAP